MLARIVVKNYALIRTLELEFDDGLSVLTGETGAGKSILLGALGLTLGARADRDAVRSGADRADVSSVFSPVGPAVLAWLTERDLLDGPECQLRRVVLADGGSRAYINGTPLPVAQLRELGALLVEIHGQRDNLHLAQKQAQRDLIDRYGGHDKLLKPVARLADEHQQTLAQMEALRAEGGDPSQIEFLKFQLEEFEGLELAPDAIQSLEQSHRRQANAEQAIAACQNALAALDADSGAQNGLADARRQLSGTKGVGDLFAETLDLIEAADIHLNEATQSLENLGAELSLDPTSLAGLESQLAVLHDLGRKHRVGVAELGDKQAELLERLDRVGGWEARSSELQTQAETQLADWKKAAAKLTRARKKASKALTQEVNALLGELAMADAKVSAKVEARADAAGPSPHGADDLGLLVQTNSGQKPGALDKIASGGELARISLALKVATTRDKSAATLIFDEVDAGVGGATAEVVGRLLKRVAQTHQVLNVTHLPQVAAQAVHHYRVNKASDAADAVVTDVERLKAKSRESELARMLGGVEITKKTLDHARDMLKRAKAA